MILVPRREIIVPKRKQGGFLLNPFRFGGVGPGPFDPSILSGLTFVFNAGASAMYKGISTSAGASTVDGDAIRRFESLNSISRIFSDNSASPSLELNEFGTGLAAMKQNQAALVLYNTPAGTANPSGSQPLSNLFTASTKLLMWAGVVDAADTNSGIAYSNNRILSDQGGYCGLYCYQTGSNIVFQWHNYSGGSQIRTITVAAGTPAVLVCRHDGGNLRFARDNVTWSSPTTSGNTDSLSAQGQFGKISGTFQFRTAAFVTCNATNTDANILTVVKQMGALVGLSL